MKKSQIVILVFFIVITGLIYVALSSNRKGSVKSVKEEKTTQYLPIREVNNKSRVLQLNSHGQVTPYSEVVVSSEVQGMLEKGDVVMKPGSKFSAGTVLYRINNEESYYSYIAKRSAYANMILNIIPDIELDFPTEKEKWFRFMDEINKVGRLPDFPTIKNNKERMFVTSRSIISEYYNLKSIESRLDKYFIIAPFSGTVVDVFIEPGTIANPGAQIAKIAKTSDFEVKVPIALDDLEFFEQKTVATFTNASGEKVGTGKIKRTSNVVNQQTQSVDVYYSITPQKDAMVYNGMFLNVSINKEVTKKTMTLPRVAVKDNKVAVLDEGKIFFRDVLIIGSKPDSVFVTGLKDGEKAVLEHVNNVEKNVTYQGVKR